MEMCYDGALVLPSSYVTMDEDGKTVSIDIPIISSKSIYIP